MVLRGRKDITRVIVVSLGSAETFFPVGGHEGGATWASNYARRRLAWPLARRSRCWRQPATSTARQCRREWTAPRTPDGQPDLQGVWLSKTATPLERPKALEGRSLLTDEEVAELQARANRLFNEGNSDFAAGDGVFLAALSNPDRFKSPTSTHSSEDMIEREFDRHTSLIVDPPDGRIPPQTDEAQRRREAAAAAARRPSIPKTSTTRSAASRGACPGSAGAMAPVISASTRFCRRRATCSCTWRPVTRPASFPLTDARTCREACSSGAATRAAAGTGQTLVIETTNFSPKSNFLGSAAGLQPGRAPDARRPRRDPLRDDDERSGDLDAGVDRGDAAETVDRDALRVGLPRGEFPHHDGHALGRPRAGTAAGAPEVMTGDQVLTARARTCMRRSTRDPRS